MPNASTTHARERRWLLLAEEGSHSWLGRATDPDEDDIARAEASLERAGVGGWIAVSEGDYWGRREMTLLQVRQLGTPKVSFEEAADAFMERRRVTMGALSQTTGDEPPPAAPGRFGP